jgi:hypothetical protein
MKRGCLLLAVCTFLVGGGENWPLPGGGKYEKLQTIEEENAKEK